MFPTGKYTLKNTSDQEMFMVFINGDILDH